MKKIQKTTQFTSGQMNSTENKTNNLEVVFPKVDLLAKFVV